MKEHVIATFIVERPYAAEVRDKFKARYRDGVAYRRMWVPKTKSAYKLLSVSGDADTILDIAMNNEHVVDIFRIW